MVARTRIRRFEEGRAVVWMRALGGTLMIAAGIWLIVAGELYRRHWLFWVGPVLFVLGAYLAWIGWRDVRRQVE
jgi:threonine/homoserine/homoserine lactone efflux protein